MSANAKIQQTEQSAAPCEPSTGFAAASAPRCYSLPPPPRVRPPDTFTAEGNLVWYDLGDGN
jgi:hypothetical protein